MHLFKDNKTNKGASSPTQYGFDRMFHLSYCIKLTCEYVEYFNLKIQMLKTNRTKRESTNR